ncbi:MAG: PAS domain-containing sensor histidine kinase [Magnetococcales bacterium]|nr:PAS domain-containing sensor histidine kinase [Magnetococcales bacterium]
MKQRKVTRHQRQAASKKNVSLARLVQLRSAALLTAYVKIDERQEELSKVASIVSASSDHMSLLDANYTYQVVNDSYLEYWGKTREMIIGHSVADLLGREIFDEKIRLMLDECLAGRSINYEAWFDFPTRGRRFMNVSYYPYLDRRRVVSGVVVIARDMTELKAISDALEESEHRFRCLFDAMPAGVAVYRPTEDGEDFIFRDMNKSGQRISEVDVTAIRNRPLTKVMPGVARMGLLQVFQEVNRSGRPQSHSLTLYQDQRTSHWVENYVYKLPNGELVAIYEDWTDRKRLEESVKSMAKFPNENPYPVLRVLRNGTLIFTNASAIPLLQAWGCGIGEKLPEPQLTRFQSVIDSGKNRIIEESLGERIYSLNLVPFPDSGYINLYAMDITPLKKALAQLEERNQIIENINLHLEQRVLEGVRQLRDKDAILIHQSRRAAMGEMINTIAHQWRQPLNTLVLIIANIESACLTCITPEKTSKEKVLQEKVVKAYNIIQQMSETIDDFRRFFRPDKVPVPFNLSQTVQEAIPLFDCALSSLGIALDLTIKDPMLPLMGYPNELSQTLLILVSNAKDAIQESKQPSGRIVINVTRSEEHGVITVDDNGGGIPPSVVDHIFDPYFTTKDDTHGTGIGLHIAKMIIEQNMQGNLTTMPLPGGTRFEIRLPLHNLSEADLNLVNQGDPDTQGHRI